MATFITKAKKSENIQVNFNESKEITYWAKKCNISTEAFQQLFKDSGYSISRLLASGALKNKLLV